MTYCAYIINTNIRFTIFRNFKKSNNLM